MRLLIPVLAGAAFLEAADRREQAVARVRAALEQRVAGFEAQVMAAARPTPAIRDVTNCALARLALGHDPREAERLLRFAFARLNQDRAAEDFGPAGPLLIHYSGRLSPEFRRDLAPQVTTVLVAMRRQQIPASETSAFLIKTVGLILMGEAAGDAEAAAEGYTMADQWIEYTRRAGIHEFGSPAQYAMDLGSLMMGYLYAARTGTREKFRRILDHFWTEIAANYFEGRGALAGPRARDSVNPGALPVYFDLVGLDHPFIETVDFESVYALESALNGGYTPGREILATAALENRTVIARWDTLPGSDRYHYLTRDFSIGSANGDYGDQDHTIAAQLSSPQDPFPAITIVPDRKDEPYDQRRHIPLRPTILQHEGTVLAMLDLDLSGQSSWNTSTDVVLPAAADRVTLEGAVVNVAEPVTKPMRLNDTVVVRKRNACVTVRVFAADGAAGSKPEIELKSSFETLNAGVARVAIYHYRGPQRQIPDKHVRVGVLMQAAPCPAVERGFSEGVRIEQTSDSKTWTVAARIGDLKLEAVRDMYRSRTVSRKINGTEVEAPVFSINGKNIELQP